MKKLIILFLIMTNLALGEFVLEKTGFYIVTVKKMPFWQFWNYNKALKLLADMTGQSIESIATTIELKMPVLFTSDYEKAAELCNTLSKIDCQLEIREMKFSCENEEQAKQIELQMGLAQLADRLIS